MVLPTGESPISFSGIRTEFGTAGAESSTAPVRLGQYRRDDSAFTNKDVGGLLNQPLDEGISTSGAINVDAFHGKRLNVIIDYHSGATENRPVVAKSKYAASSTSEGNSTGNWNVIGGYRNPPSSTAGTKTRIHVNKEIGSSNTNTNNCAVRTGTGWNAGTVLTVEIGSSGALYGAGGNGGDGGTSDSEKDGTNGSAGSSALGIQYSGTTIINDGLIINGFGGGGGGGYRKVEREEWFSGPVYAAGGGGGGAGQGLPSGTAGSGSGGGGGTFYEEVSGSPFYVTTSGSESQVLQTMGIIATVDTVSANDATRTAGTYNVTTYNAQGSGTGATFSIVIANDANKTVTVNVTTGGSGYVVNNTITVAAAQIGGTGAALTFDVASISSLFTFKKGGSTVGSNTNGDAVIVGDGTTNPPGTQRYVLFAENDDATSVETANPVVDNSPSNRIFRITEYELISGGSSSSGGGTGSKTAGGSGGNGGERSQAHGGGGGGGGSNGTGGEGGNNNDGGNGTSSSGGNGADGTHTGSIEGENNVTGEGGTGGGNGAAIRRTSGITVNITNNGTITGSQTATGVS